LTELKTVTLGQLVDQLQPIILAALREGYFIEIVKLRHDLALIFSYLTGLEPKTVLERQAIDRTMRLIVSMQQKISGIYLAGLIPEKIDGGDLLADEFQAFREQWQRIGYFAFPASLSYLDSVLVRE
jgi:hypothetical protein